MPRAAALGLAVEAHVRDRERGRRGSAPVPPTMTPAHSQPRCGQLSGTRQRRHDIGADAAAASTGPNRA